MGLIFSLSTECGTQEAAEAVAEHFRGMRIRIADGSEFSCWVGTYHDETWWCTCVPEGVSKSGICSDQDAQQMTEMGFALYERLRTAPPYRYALVGVEADSFRFFSELDEDLINLDFSGLVLADSIWKQLGSPDIYVPFVPGYRWRPFVRAS